MNYYDLPPDLQESYADLDEESKQYPLVWTPGREGQIPRVIRFKTQGGRKQNSSRFLIK